MAHPNHRLSTAARFELYVVRSGECHRWTSMKTRGYGRFWFNGKTHQAHIIALQLAGVEIPEGMTVDHVWARGCQFADCVRVEHLEVVPMRVNVLRSNNLCALNARKTHCKRGHEFTDDNIIRKPGRPTSRICLQCKREYGREHMRRARAKRAAA